MVLPLRVRADPDFFRFGEEEEGKKEEETLKAWL
jgi:hypothetical protein